MSEDEFKELLIIDGAFEGDLKIPVETIVKYYNFSSVPGIEIDMLDESNFESGNDTNNGRGSGLEIVFESAEDGEQDAGPHIHDRRAGVAGSNNLWTDNEVNKRKWTTKVLNMTMDR